MILKSLNFILLNFIETLVIIIVCSIACSYRSVTCVKYEFMPYIVVQLTEIC